jgi:pseudouridine-5'-monophosphatase
VIYGDDMTQGRMKGKPWPDIFLTAARDKLGMPVGGVQGTCTKEEGEVRGRGLIFEDAILGVQAGKRAGMSGKCCLMKPSSARWLTSNGYVVIWVPDANLLDVDCDGADQLLKSIEEFEPEKWGLPPY